MTSSGVNAKRVLRLYRLEGLQLPRKVMAKARETRPPVEAPNDCWAMDFVADQLFDGQKLRMLTIVDIASKVSPAIG